MTRFEGSSAHAPALAWALPTYAILLVGVGVACWSLAGSRVSQEEAARELRRSEEMLADAQRIAHLGSWRWSPAEGFSHSLEMTRIFALAPEAAGLEAFTARLHPEDRDELRRTLRQVQSSGEPASLEHRIVTDRGEVRTVLSLVERTGKLDASLSGAVLDITERKKLERVKDEFLSTVSHELRTPLTAIRGSLGLMGGGAAGPLPEPLARLVDLADRNTARLGRLVDELLDVARLESGERTLDLEEVSLVALVDQAVRENQDYASPLGVRYEVVSRDEAAISGDPRRLLQVLANLLSNAAKFSPAGSTVEVGVQAAEGRARVFVRDRGPGVPEEMRSMVFEKFTQVDSSDDRPRGGTGLGLYITRQLVEHHGGRVGVDPGPDGGAVFWADLPLRVPD